MNYIHQMKNYFKSKKTKRFTKFLFVILIGQILTFFFLFGHAFATSPIVQIQPEHIALNNLNNSQYDEKQKLNPEVVIQKNQIKPTATPVEITRPLNPKIKISIIGLGTLSIIIVLIGLWLNYKKLKKILN